MKFKTFGYKSQDEYFDEFFKTLLPSNRTADFFVKWEKVYGNVNKYLDEVYLLNSLVTIKEKSDRKEHLEELLKKYPKTRLVLPLIIAIRDKKINMLKIKSDNNITYLDIDFGESSIDKILDFCEETKIVDLFGNIKDLYSFLTGVEVGLDTNARKNRSGSIFEELVLKALRSKGVDARKADKKLQIGDRSKTPDLIIFKNNESFAIVEVNFFNELGSKPLETVQSYIKLQGDVEKKHVKFIMITDGPAWKTGIDERKKAFEQIDYVFNFNLAIKLIPKMVGINN